MNYLEKWKSRRGHTRMENNQRLKLQADMQEVLAAIDQNTQRFNLAADECLLDAIIFEHNALMAHYSYLLGQVRGANETPNTTVG